MRTRTVGANGFDGDGGSTGSVPRFHQPRKSGGKQQLPTLTWHWPPKQGDPSAPVSPSEPESGRRQLTANPLTCSWDAGENERS